MSRTVLLIDADKETRSLLDAALRDAGFSVIQAENGAAGLRAARTVPPLLVVSELDLPDGDGFDLCRELKRDLRSIPVPFLFVTRRNAEIDRILAFELGADDYILKPFYPREVVLRIRRSVARRLDPIPEEGSELRAGRLTVDLLRGEVRVCGRPVALAAQEFRLLSLLMRRTGAIHSRERILRDAWNSDGTRDSRTIDTHIRRLRLKLGPVGCYLENVRNMGYRLRPRPFARTNAKTEAAVVAA